MGRAVISKRDRDLLRELVENGLHEEADRFRHELLSATDGSHGSMETYAGNSSKLGPFAFDPSPDFVLSAEAYARVVDLIDNPPPPSPKLIRVLRGIS